MEVTKTKNVTNGTHICVGKQPREDVFSGIFVLVKLKYTNVCLKICLKCITMNEVNVLNISGCSFRLFPKEYVALS